MLPLGSNLGKIRVVERIGRGTSGEVYVGFDQALERRVALKTLEHFGGRSAADRVRLLREARILSRLTHPNICQVYDFIEGDEVDVLVLELVDGRTLEDVLAERRLDSDEQIRIALEIARALEAAHAEGVAHRDLKPSNVMLVGSGLGRGGSRHGDGGPIRVKVLDFGLALLSDLHRDKDDERTPDDPYRRPLVPSELEQASVSSTSMRRSDVAFQGTPRYCSPEQARGEDSGTSGDAYSFGLVLQEMATGRPAYPGTLTFVQLLRDAATARTAPLKDVDPELAALIRRLLGLAPTTRPRAVDAVAWLERLANRPRRRRRRRAIFGGMVVLAALAAAMTFQAVRIMRLNERLGEQVDLARSRQLTAEATTRFGEEIDLALLLAIEALDHSPTLEARSALLGALQTAPSLRTILRDHSRRIHRLAWSPDGVTLAAATSSGTVIWETVDNYRQHVLGGHQGSVWSLAWSPDGRILATAGQDRTVRLWDAVSAAPLGAPLTGHALAVWALAWSPDGETLASGDDQGKLLLWDIAERDAVILKESGEAIFDFAWHPDGRRLAMSTYQGSIEFWDPVTRKRLEPLLKPHGGIASTLAWSPDGATLASGGEDGMIRFWSRFGDPLGEPLAAHDGLVWDVVWSPDGTTLASSGRDKTVRLWNARDRAPLGPPRRGHHHEVWSVAFRPDGQRLTSGSLDGTLLVWDPRPQRLYPIRAHSSWARVVNYRPNGLEILSAGVDGAIRRWSAFSGEALEPLVEGWPTAFGSLAWSPGGARLAAAGEASEILLLEADTGHLEATLRGHQDSIWDLSWQPVGRILASASADRTVRLWDTDLGRQIGEPLGGHDGTVRAVAWQPDGRHLVSGCQDGRIRQWRPDGTLERTFIAHEGGVAALAWSPDGRRLASAGEDHAVRLWDVDGAPIGSPLIGHGNAVSALAWSPDGRHLASGGRDAVVLVWDAVSGEPWVRLTGHEGGVLDLTWSPDSQYLLSSGTDGTLRTYDLSGDVDAWRSRACRRARRDLTKAEWERFLGTDSTYHSTCGGAIGTDSSAEALGSSEESG